MLLPFPEALQQAAARQETLTLARVLRELPGESVTIDLEEAVWHIGGISRQQRQAEGLQESHQAVVRLRHPSPNSQN